MSYTTVAISDFETISLRLPGLLASHRRSEGRNTPSFVKISGCDSVLPVAATLSNSADPAVDQVPQLVVVESQDQANAFKQALRFFSPSTPCHVLPSFDVGPYSGLYPNPRLISERVAWMHRAQNSVPGEIFVATVTALAQRTIPFSELSAHSQIIHRGQVLPDDITLVLQNLGYSSAPLVEDVGTFAWRGGILDVFSPAHAAPVRIELFGDQVESMRGFDPDTQRSSHPVESLVVVPPREIIWNEERRESVVAKYRKQNAEQIGREDHQAILHSLSQGQSFPGIDFLLPLFYSEFSLPLEHFSQGLIVWWVKPLDCTHEHDQFLNQMKKDFEGGDQIALRVSPQDLYVAADQVKMPQDSVVVQLEKVAVTDLDHVEDLQLEYRGAPLGDFAARCLNFTTDTVAMGRFASDRILGWKDQNQSVFVAVHTSSQSQRLRAILDGAGLEAAVVEETSFRWESWREEQRRQPNLIHIIPRSLPESLRLVEEDLVLLREEDFFGRKKSSGRSARETGSLQKRAHALSFGDLKPGDLVVHKQHGVGVYDGLKVMSIDGVESELIQLSYKDGDRLYLPVYRVAQIQKYSGPGAARVLDKLGGQAWEKSQIKVRRQLRDLAADLLALYAKRAQLHRPPFPPPREDYLNFESMFPYDETDDQLKALEDIHQDLSSDRPMDRLICGDVGFGKTEVAMRAAFRAVEGGKQVAVVAPTTVLAFQHVETFRRRFKSWPVRIEALHRFLSTAETKKNLAGAKSGEIDILIGTHRMLSRDVEFARLGLLIVDEEQKFGVKHKEKIRKQRTDVDTLVLSATPIPRTLNLSLVGIRDLSLINTAPMDRLPTRTFVTKFEPSVIRKAILAEISRGGQVFFLHNRVQSIYGVLDELRQIAPEARFGLAHGQMPENQLEKAMLGFFQHEFDVLVCTAIVESGVDIPRANTMFIDNAHQFGLSQLYQLRGRVGRSKERAYCYLLAPRDRRLDADAKERLRVIQENTALGSGIRIAQHDLELRGSGDILGEDQSGHIQAVGYELYMELLEEAIRNQKGESIEAQSLEPEINVRIPALIPDSYISDLRIRLSYYKALSEISGEDDVDRIEDELRDQFGKPPEQVVNLMGLMLIRKLCKELGIKDLSSGKAQVSLSFTEFTRLPVPKVIELTTRQAQKYSLTPDNRLNVRIKELSWPRIYEELKALHRLIPASA